VYIRLRDPPDTLGLLRVPTCRRCSRDCPATAVLVRTGAIVLEGTVGMSAFIEDDVVFIEVGPVGPMRQFGDHAKRVLGQARPSRAGFVPLERRRAHGRPRNPERPVV
jgi:hypothetical protein